MSFCGVILAVLGVGILFFLPPLWGALLIVVGAILIFSGGGK